MPPIILFVPGLWEGPRTFDGVAAQLHAAGYTTETASLVSTGTRSPNNPSMVDDAAAIRKHIAALVDQDQEVVLVAHSAGGFLAAIAVEGLEAPKRAAAGKTGGVSRFVFLAAGLAPVGADHKPQPFMDMHEDGSMTCKDPADLLMHDVPDAAKWLAALQVQPASGWDARIEYAGWQHLPSVYVVAAQDKVLPPDMQRQMAGLVGAEVKEIDCGHMMQLARPVEVAAFVRDAIV